MEIIVKSRNCTLPARLRDDAVARVRHATRFFDRLVGIEVMFSEGRGGRAAEPAVVEVTARSKGHHIRAQGTGRNHESAADVAIARFERQLARYKARLVDRSQRPRRAVQPSGDGAVAVAEAVPATTAPTPRIVRRKTFELTPMLPEDAAWQLELLGHEFFLFNNAATGHCAVVYRRRDGELGMIEAAE